MSVVRRIYFLKRNSLKLFRCLIGIFCGFVLHVMKKMRMEWIEYVNLMSSYYLQLDRFVVLTYEIRILVFY